MSVVTYTDGGARGNPGPSGAGAVVYHNGVKVAELKKYLGEHTNNWAEYEAVVMALTEVKKRGIGKEKIELRMDSQLIARQLSGQYRVKDAHLKEKYLVVKELLTHCGQATFTHVPREKNKEADALANIAMDEGYEN
jgi:ribonuclease HI